MKDSRGYLSQGGPVPSKFGNLYQGGMKTWEEPLAELDFFSLGPPCGPYKDDTLL
jgi:hypothetical protein